MAAAIRSPIGKPFSAVSIAGCSTCANVIVPQRSSSVYQASTTPGTVPESSVSLCGSFPPRFFWYHSIVASRGAVPSALMDTTAFALASYTRITASLPTPLDAASTRPSTAWPATAASNALPRACRIRSAARVASAFIEAAACVRPRTTGRIVEIRTSSDGSCALRYTVPQTRTRMPPKTNRRIRINSPVFFDDHYPVTPPAGNCGPTPPCLQAVVEFRLHADQQRLIGQYVPPASQPMGMKASPCKEPPGARGPRSEEHT